MTSSCRRCPLAPVITSRPCATATGSPSDGVGVADRDAVQMAAGAPDLGAQQRSAAAPGGARGGRARRRCARARRSWSKVIGRRTPARVGCSRPIVAARPAPGQRRDMPGAGLVAGLQRRLARERERRRDDALDALGRQVQLLAALVEVVAQAREPLAHAPLLRQQRRAAPRLSLERALVERARGGRASPPRPDAAITGAGAAEVLADLLDLARPRARGSRGRRRASPLRSALSQPALDEVVDEHLLGGLAVAVDAAVALLEPVRVPRDLAWTSRWQWRWRAMPSDAASVASRIAHRVSRRAAPATAP